MLCQQHIFFLCLGTSFSPILCLNNGIAMKIQGLNYKISFFELNGRFQILGSPSSLKIYVFWHVTLCNW
jgi:hypothetical protein